MTHPTYRPEIDGLRAIAVISVILFHLELGIGGVDPFRGGYIGVDIFFVISGYLIIGQIVSGLHAGTFSFAHFYERRARRLLPVALTVMLVSVPVAWWLLLPDAMLGYAESVLAALAYSSNFYFWLNNSYWGPHSLLTPFLHTWSLSVEEQFYFVVPLLLVLAHRFGRNGPFRVCVGVALASLVLAQLTHTVFPDFSFYSLATRGWEMLAGGIVAIAHLRADHRKSANWFEHRLLAPVGLAFIILSVAIFRPDTPHPSIITLMPVLATMAFLAYRPGNDGISGWTMRLMSSGLMVKIGLLSYGLYLWHFPIFAFGRALNAFPGIFDKLAWLALTVALTMASYTLLEKPCRDARKVSLRSLLTLIVSGMVLIAGLMAWIIATDGAPQRFSDDKRSFAQLDDRGYQQAFHYVSKAYVDDVQAAQFSDDGRKKILLIGDSYSQDFYNILKAAGFAETHDISAHYIQRICSNVTAERAKNHDIEQAMGRADCSQAVRVGHPGLEEKLSDADAVILASAWNELTAKYLGELIAEIKARGPQRVLVVGRKQLGKLSAWDLRTHDLPNLLEKRLPVAADRHAVSETMRAMDLEFYVDLQAYLCGASQRCPVSDGGGNLLSPDGSHLTASGVNLAAGKLQSDEAFLRFYNFDGR